MELGLTGHIKLDDKYNRSVLCEAVLDNLLNIHGLTINIDSILEDITKNCYFTFGCIYFSNTKKNIRLWFEKIKTQIKKLENFMDGPQFLTVKLMDSLNDLTDVYDDKVWFNTTNDYILEDRLSVCFNKIPSIIETGKNICKEHNKEKDFGVYLQKYLLDLI